MAPSIGSGIRAGTGRAERRARSRRPGRRLVAAASAALLALPLAAVPVASAGTTITVTTTAQGINDDAACSLQEAIYAANLDASKAPDPAHLDDPSAFIATACEAGSGADVIDLPTGATFTMLAPVIDPDGYVGPTATPIVLSAITIEAHGSKIQYGGTKPFRAFAVGVGGDLTIHEAWIHGFGVHGGNGAAGGGGGMGAGGAIYVHHGRLGIGWTTFDGNGAVGGNGSGGNFGAGGGGGGLGGNGGGADHGGGGGGGGAAGAGADGPDFGCGFICAGGSPGAGGGGTIEDGQYTDGGLYCGGDGSSAIIDEFFPFFRDGGDGKCRGGGAGGGQEATISGIGGVFGGDGGTGEYGGGGGGAAYKYESGDGGHGGFGGGGGGSNTSGSNVTGVGPSGGDGNFGGGGGAGAGGYLPGAAGGGPGAGGSFAGDGSTHAGGGGAGLGGAIFGHEATIVIINSTFEGNYANRGHSGGEGANDGRGAGGAIFLVAGSLSINNATFADNQTGEFPDAGNGKVGGGAIVVYKPSGNAGGDDTSFSLRNSIIAGNGPNHECYTKGGPSVSASHNLILEGSKPSGDEYGVCDAHPLTTDPGLDALAMNAPGTTPTMKLPGGSAAANAADPATAEPDDQRGVLRPVGPGPDLGAYESTSSPPTTTISLSPATPDGAHGWYVTGVGVTVSATDPDNDVTETRCDVDPTTAPASFGDLTAGACQVTSVADDGEHAVYAASVDSEGATDAGVASATFKIDATDPTLSPALNVPSPITVGQTGVSASANASDATSGVDTSSCGTVDTSTPGVHSVTCTATDNAGNVGSAQLTYVVEYRILGFFSPVPGSKWKVSQTVPVKIALANGAGVRIPDAEAAALAKACRVTFVATGAQSKSPQCMKYDPATDQFIYTWKLAKSPTGDATISARISYPGTTTTTTLSEAITITR